MGKYLYISEKPSVAQEFAKALRQDMKRRDGYLESEESIVTWCVGHLVTMSYPECYDPALKTWSLETLPFLPKKYRYEVIDSVSKQFRIVKEQLCRKDVSRIYVCTDSGREGEYIYRLVDQMAGVPDTVEKRRVWIDSQTEEEILRGIREAKPLSEYDALSASAYLRAKEDYLMGINFSRVLTLKYGNAVQSFLRQQKRGAISVGRVMTCVLGMVVRREREIRAFVKTPFYRVFAGFSAGEADFFGEFRAVEGSEYYESPLLYKENGFRKREDALTLLEKLGASAETKTAAKEEQEGREIARFSCEEGITGEIESIEKKSEKKYPPLLYNLAELQNECARLFKISPDETLKIAQELYEKKLVTYPRTDARVLSTAVAKEIGKHIKGLGALSQYGDVAKELLESGSYRTIAKTKYVDDKQITDHYAIIPTGQGFSALSSLSPTALSVYHCIVKRFLCIFYPPAQYRKISLVLRIGKERFFAAFKALEVPGYLKLAGEPQTGKRGNTDEGGKESEEVFDLSLLEQVKNLKKGMQLPVRGYELREGETSPPKRYNSGTLILAMENAGSLIEDEDLRAQIKGSGIGTSATRAEILNKLFKISYLKLNKKTQIVTPLLLGELIYEVVNASIRAMLNAELTASWEKGLTYVAEGSITEEEYMQKLEGFITRMTEGVKGLQNQSYLRQAFDAVAVHYAGNTSESQEDGGQKRRRMPGKRKV